VTAPFAAEVGRYLADCTAYARVLSPAYHPTEDGALKLIHHRGQDQAAQIRAAFRAVAGDQARSPAGRGRRRPGQGERPAPDGTTL
jgi:hypothetical protein